MFVHKIEKTKQDANTESFMALGEALYDSLDVANDDVVKITKTEKNNYINSFIVLTKSGKEYKIDIT